MRVPARFTPWRTPGQVSMSVYAELLAKVVDDDARTERSVPELVAAVLARRAAVASGMPRGRAAGVDTAAGLGDWLSYDAALVQLCRRLGVDQDLTGPRAGPASRHQAEERLAERLPGLAALLSDSPADTRGGTR